MRRRTIHGNAADTEARGAGACVLRTMNIYWIRQRGSYQDEAKPPELIRAHTLADAYTEAERHHRDTYGHTPRVAPVDIALIFDVLAEKRRKAAHSEWECRTLSEDATVSADERAGYAMNARDYRAITDCIDGIYRALNRATP